MSVSLERIYTYSIADVECIAIGIYKPPDVRPILAAYRDKDIPLEYAKKEAEARQKHIEDWQNTKKGIARGGFTLSNLFGSSTNGSVSHRSFVMEYLLTTACAGFTHRNVHLQSPQHIWNKNARKHNVNTRTNRPTSSPTRKNSKGSSNKIKTPWLKKFRVTCGKHSVPCRSRPLQKVQAQVRVVSDAGRCPTRSRRRGCSL